MSRRLPPRLRKGHCGMPKLRSPRPPIVRTSSRPPNRSDGCRSIASLSRSQHQSQSQRRGSASAASAPEGPLVAAAIGILGLIFSVVLAVGALTVAIGAGEGNAIYDPLSTVCDALAGPLKDAFSFTGPTRPVVRSSSAGVPDRSSTSR